MANNQVYSKCCNAIRDFDGSAHHCHGCGQPSRYADCAPVIGQVLLRGDVLCDELQPTVSTDLNHKWPITRWLRVVADAPESEQHGAYKAGLILTLTAGLADKDVSPVADPLAEAQAAHRPHSLIGSQRTWQLHATIPGVCQAWGYAYEDGNFNR